MLEELDKGAGDDKSFVALRLFRREEGVVLLVVVVVVVVVLLLVVENSVDDEDEEEEEEEEATASFVKRSLTAFSCKSGGSMM